ncbi:hypothetical protein CERSUDRAFT_74233 [Gelatoporia subvermispora B]|uniref:Uncharacterized protein n=1 Tax=Ceriporiopsis subvermispora (strain B) TaxID=914234 RepID=M2QVS6_CERS8|nr:hypothetical protein CERSUDRAFT_74233 [Gelatoporia subvermispora B]
MAPFNPISDPWYTNPAIRGQFKNNLHEAMSLLGENRQIKRKIHVKFECLILELVNHHKRSEHHMQKGDVNDSTIQEHKDKCDCLLSEQHLEDLERTPSYMDSEICDSIDQRVRIHEPHIGEHQGYHLQSSIRLQEELCKVFNEIKVLRDLAVEVQTIISMHTALYNYDPEPYSETDCLDCRPRWLHNQAHHVLVPDGRA